MKEGSRGRRVKVASSRAKSREPAFRPQIQLLRYLPGETPTNGHPKPYLMQRLDSKVGQETP
jgi:hypothetical protein